MTQTRHPSGVPTGGQFAPAPLTEVGILLISGKQEEDVQSDGTENDYGRFERTQSPDVQSPAMNQDHGDPSGADAGHEDDHLLVESGQADPEPVTTEPAAPGLELMDEAEWQTMLEHNRTGTFEFPAPPLHWAQVVQFWSEVTIPPAVMIAVRDSLPQAREAEIRRRVDEEFTEPAPARAQYVLQKSFDKVYAEWRSRYSEVYWRVAKDVGPENIASFKIRGLIVAEMRCRQAEFLVHSAGRDAVLQAPSAFLWSGGRPMSNFEVSCFFGMRNLTDEVFQDPDARMSGKLAELYTVTQNMAAHIEELRNEREFRAIADSSATDKEADKRLRAAGFKEW